MPEFIPQSPEAGGKGKLRGTKGETALSAFYRKARSAVLDVQSIRRLLPSGAGGDALGGAATITGTGAAEAPAPASGQQFRHRSVRSTSAATAGATASIRLDNPTEYISARQGCGGFFARMAGRLFGSTVVANARCFMGMHSAAADIGNVNPSTLTNLIGIGADAGETTLSLIYNDGSGTATKLALGAAFPAQAQSGQEELYELALASEIASGTVYYVVHRVSTGDTAFGEIATDIPLDTPLTFHLWGNNGTTAAATSVALVDFAAFTPNE